MGKNSFQQMVFEHLDIYMQKNKIGTLPHTHIKINSKQIRDLHVRAKTLKLFEKNRGKSL